MKKCFIHNIKMIRIKTSFGDLWKCPESDCDVKCWGGPTSHPGTQEDFDERTATHKIFDKTWQDENGLFSRGEKVSRNKRRGRAYKWLSEFLKIPRKNTHIGMLRAEQCREVQRALIDLQDDTH